jgi:hypothetical protein
MPYGRQIAKEEQRQDRCVQVSEGEARRQEVEGFFQEQRIAVIAVTSSSRAVEPGSISLTAESR